LVVLKEETEVRKYGDRSSRYYEGAHIWAENNAESVRIVNQVTWNQSRNR